MFTKTHQHQIHKLIHLKDRLGRLYVHLIIQAFASSLVSIFIPIHLLVLGFELKLVFLFLLVQWASFSLLAPIAGYIVNRVGLKEVILLRTPLFILGLVLLSLMQNSPFIRKYYLFIALLLSVSSVLYTLSITSLFSQFMHQRKKNLETSRFISLPMLGTIIGPFIGGFIAIKLGFPILFSLVSVILLASVIPLAFVRNKVDHPRFSFKHFLGFFSKYKKLFFYINLYGVRGFVFYLVLPILIYFSTDSVFSLGIVVSIISLLDALFLIKLGTLYDKRNKKKVFKLGAAVTALFLVVLGLTTNTPFFVYVSLLSGIVAVLIRLPFESELYSQAKKTRSFVSFLAFKEFSFLFGTTLLLVFLILLSEKLELSFFLGALASALFAFF